ncbi:hypothetical protein BDA96_01G081300 [Sorghum bicolor]|uniref:Uncharacterized protein n=1 Tax=Sorghum bicolor TaxID=4558 RepID=A0A921UZH1_SORBI|nr:hypothetical protein BDA96_01G081300 [Sorghum bicolor]
MSFSCYLILLLPHCYLIFFSRFVYFLHNTPIFHFDPLQAINKSSMFWTPL